MREIRAEISSPVDLMPILAGKVFHITPSTNMDSIIKKGAILPNQSGEWSSLFGNSSNGFFRLRGCVSFFDYREYGQPQWEEHAYKCMPGQILERASSISALVLSKGRYSALESWSNWKVEEKWSQRVVPHIEIGHKGAVSLENIVEHIIVSQKCS
jgi:hypothetical protein